LFRLGAGGWSVRRRRRRPSAAVVGPGRIPTSRNVVCRLHQAACNCR
jgi:hypothetical protein